MVANETQQQYSLKRHATVAHCPGVPQRRRRPAVGTRAPPTRRACLTLVGVALAAISDARDPVRSLLRSEPADRTTVRPADCGLEAVRQGVEQRSGHPGAESTHRPGGT